MTDVTIGRFSADDGVELAWHEMGEGRPIVLIHGYFSNAFTNWIRYGHARLIADAGFRVIMPDLRAHGESGKPHEAASYPPDVLAADGFALLRHLGLEDYDLAGYSLGGRTTTRMLVQGARPRRAVLCGMGLDGILHTAGRGDYFRRVLTGLGSFERGSSEWMTEAFLKTTKGDPVALLHILETFVDTSRAELAAIDLPVLVVTGAEDDDNGSGEALADAIPGAAFRSIPGNHMSAVLKPELGQAIREFLAA
ncbi:Pimeloyl-ACP methyl ester carboxylesterase [Sphingomonas laterariae]|uniref:Pimeloyl-ACP methyl ester carboxylesterase n=1 Tax=Edaphosphingomonas laterariae TaxID=861865 RepID=A0A239BR23_9SPHN|nr:alpha/beta fold hydrolase [Sphingomonas laterariae]SNS10102.1 Pimeloyl-ACP methyl ester carboxylesterase [Sphingomonas laterariae]